MALIWLVLIVELPSSYFFPDLFFLLQVPTAPYHGALPMSTSVEEQNSAFTWANCATAFQTAPMAGTRDHSAEVPLSHTSVFVLVHSFYTKKHQCVSPLPFYVPSQSVREAQIIKTIKLRKFLWWNQKLGTDFFMILKNLVSFKKKVLIKMTHVRKK